MTEDVRPEGHPRSNGSPAAGDSDADRIASLLRLAGPRAAVPADRMRRVKAEIHAQWQQLGRARRRRRIMAWSVGAVAAAAVLLAGVRLTVREDPAPAGPGHAVATVEVLRGAAHLMAAPQHAAAPAPLQVGDRLREGDGVDTTAGGPVALRLAAGASVRLDRGTRLRLLSDAAIALEGGTLYIDSGSQRGDRSIEVHTPLGVARDVGTRFEVRFDGSALRLRVRDGLVRLAATRQSHDVRPGNELTVDDEGQVAWRPVAVHGPDWSWATGLARPFELEGQSVRAFVEWIAGENGWQVHFADAAVRAKAQTTIVHGSIQGLTPEEALSAVLPTGGLTHRLDDGVLEIGPGVDTMKD